VKDFETRIVQRHDPNDEASIARWDAPKEFVVYRVHIGVQGYDNITWYVEHRYTEILAFRKALVDHVGDFVSVSVSIDDMSSGGGLPDPALDGLIGGLH